MSATAAKLNVEFSSSGVGKVTNDISGVGKSLDSANGKSSGFFSNMMSTAGGFLVAGGLTQIKDQILGIGGAMITSNSNMEMWTKQLEVSTGSIDGANAVIKNMTQMAKISPFDLPQLIQSANALESLGFSSQKWMPIIGDTAAATGKSIDQVTQAVMDASTGEFERLKELGIRTKVEGDKIQFSFMKNGQMMTVEAENNAEGIENALMGIWDDKYSGSMAAMSDTWTGRLSNLKDNINMLMMDAGKPLFDFMKGAVGGANKYLEAFTRRMEQGQGVVHSLLWAIPETLRNMGLEGIAGKITPIIKGIESGWRRISSVGRSTARIVGSTLGKAFEFLGEHMDVVVTVLKIMSAQFAVALAWGAISAIIAGIGAALAFLLGPIGLAIGAVILLATAWEGNWFGIRDVVANVWDKIEPIFDWIVDAVKWIAEGFEIGGWEEAWNRIKIVASKAWGYIKGFFSDIDWGALWDGISSAAETAWTTITEAVSAAWDFITGLFDKIDWGALWDGVISAASTAWDAVSGAISGVWDWLSGLDWGGMVLATWDILSGAGSWIAEKLGSAVDALSTWFNTQFEGVDWIGTVRGGISMLASAIGDAVSGMASFLTVFYTWMTEQINSVDWNNIGQLVGNFLGIAIKAAIGLILLAADLFIQIMGELGEVGWGSLASALWGYLKVAAIAAISLLVGIGQGLWDSLSSELSGLDWDAVWGVVFAPFTGMIDTATDAWNGFMDLIGLGAGPGADMKEVDGEKQKRNPTAYSAEQRQNLLSGTAASGLGTVGDMVDNTNWLTQVAAFQAIRSAFPKSAIDPDAMASTMLPYTGSSKDAETQNRRTTRSFDMLAKSSRVFTDNLAPLTAYGGIGTQSLRDVGDAATYSGQNTSAMLISMSEGIDKTGLPAWERLRRGISDRAKDMLDDMLGLDKKGGRALEGLDRAASAAMRSIGRSFGTTAGGAAKDLLSDLLGLDTGGRSAMSRMGTGIGKTVGDMARGILSEIDFGTAGASRVMSIRTAEMVTNVGSNMGKIANSVAGNMGNVTSHIDNGTKGQSRILSIRTGAMVTNVAGNMGKIANNVASNMGNVTAHFDSGTRSVVNITSSRMGQVADLMLSGARSGVNNVGGQVGRLAGVISGASGGAANAGYNIGAAIANGAANGIDSRTWAVMARAQAMALAAFNAAKRALGINSPSKVFIDLFGFVGDGAAIGIDNGIPAVKRAIENMVGLPGTYALASPSFDFPSPGRNAPIRSGNGYQSGGTTVIDNSVYITATTEELAMIKGDAARGREFADQRRNTGGAVRYMKRG